MHALLRLGWSSFVAVAVVVEIAGLMAAMVMMRPRRLHHAFIAMPVIV